MSPARHAGWEALQAVTRFFWAGQEGNFVFRTPEVTLELALPAGGEPLITSSQTSQAGLPNSLLALLARCFLTESCELETRPFAAADGTPVEFWQAVRLYFLRRYGRDHLREAAKSASDLCLRTVIDDPSLLAAAQNACPILGSIGEPKTLHELFHDRSAHVREFIDLLALAGLGVLQFTLGDEPIDPLAQLNAGEAEIVAEVVETEPPAGMLTTETALDEAKSFLRRGWFGAAKYRFEDLLEQFPDHAEAKAYTAWIDFQTEKRPSTEHIEQTLLHVNEGLIACPRNADFHTFRGMLLKLTSRYEEAVQSFRQAMRLEPEHPVARSEKQLTDLRLQSDDWPDVDVEAVRVNAKIIIQRRIGSHVKLHSFDANEVRIGSGNNDDIIVSEAVLPHIAKRHCTVIRRDGRFFVRRNASLGRVWLNGAELEIRKEMPVRAEDCIRLGEPEGGGPTFEFRVFNLVFLHDIGFREVGGFAA